MISFILSHLGEAFFIILIIFLIIMFIIDVIRNKAYPKTDK